MFGLRLSPRSHISFFLQNRKIPGKNQDRFLKIEAISFQQFLTYILTVKIIQHVQSYDLGTFQ